MFGLFKKKLTAKDIIITNKGFHAAWNYCRNTFDHRLHDDYSNTTYQNIIINLLESLKRGANDDELSDTVLDGFELVSKPDPQALCYVKLATSTLFTSNSNNTVPAKFGHMFMNDRSTDLGQPMAPCHGKSHGHTRSCDADMISQ